MQYVRKNGGTDKYRLLFEILVSKADNERQDRAKYLQAIERAKGLGEIIEEQTRLPEDRMRLAKVYESIAECLLADETRTSSSLNSAKNLLNSCVSLYTKILRLDDIPPAEVGLKRVHALLFRMQKTDGRIDGRGRMPKRI